MFYNIHKQFLWKNKKAIKEICINYPHTAVLKGSGLQDPLCRKSRKSIYRYDSGEWYAKFQVSIVFRLRRTNRQSRRYAEITQTRQIWRQVVFMVFFRRSWKSIYGYDLGEWVCQISGLYRFSIEENKKGNKGDMQK